MSDTASYLDLPTPAPSSSTHSSEDFLVAPAASSSSAQGSGRSVSSVEGGEPQNPFITPSHLRTDSYTGSGYFPRTSPQVGARNTGQLSRKSSVNHSRNGSMPVYMRSPSLSFLGAEFVPEKRRPIFKSQLLDDSASVVRALCLIGCTERSLTSAFGLFLHLYRRSPGCRTPPSDLDVSLTASSSLEFSAESLEVPTFFTRECHLRPVFCVGYRI